MAKELRKPVAVRRGPREQPLPYSRAVGVGMFLPDFHVSFRRMRGSLHPLGWLQFLLGAHRLDAAVAQFVAVDPAYQNQGLMRAVSAELMRRLQRAGFRTLDTTWVGTNNASSLATVRAMGMRQKHALTVFEQPLVG